MLFDQDAINAWEQENRRPDMAAAGRIAQAAGEQWPDLRRNCPTCHQQCVKVQLPRSRRTSIAGCPASVGPRLLEFSVQIAPPIAQSIWVLLFGLCLQQVC